MSNSNDADGSVRSQVESFSSIFVDQKGQKAVSNQGTQRKDAVGQFDQETPFTDEVPLKHKKICELGFMNILVFDL